MPPSGRAKRYVWQLMCLRNVSTMEERSLGMSQSKLASLALALLVAIGLSAAAPSPTLAGQGGERGAGGLPDGFIGDSGAHNPDGSKVLPSRGPVSAQERRIAEQKIALAEQHNSVRRGQLAPGIYQERYIAFLQQIGERTAALKARADASRSAAAVSPMAGYSSRSLLLTQVPQEKYYYCGPASAYAILRTLGYTRSRDNETLSQSALATNKYLETEKWTGTPWYVSSADQPYPQTLNYWRTGSYSGFYRLSSSSFSAADFKRDFTADIDSSWPVGGNAWEVAGSQNPHLVGHPTNTDIFHWIAIYGYGSSGDTVAYADSVHNAPSVSWYASVPAYSSISTSTMATILNGRGYVW